MPNAVQRIIAHVDMDAFFAAVEQLDRPEYRGLPVIVGGLSGRGVVSTASYEARQFGVHSAMPMTLAKRKCPQGIFLSGNYRRYAEVSKQVFAVLDRFSPLIEPLSIDEGFLDLTGMNHVMETPAAYGAKIKDTIKRETGLIASVGIAPNKFLAKLASDLEKPNGLTIILPEKITQIIWPLPIGKLWGVGRKTEEKLQRYGYRRIGDVAKAGYEILQTQIGARQAAQLIALANGRDDRPVEPVREAQSIGKETTFVEDIVDRREAERHLLALAAQVGWRLRREGKKARTVQLKIRLDDFSTYTRQKTLAESICYDDDIYQTVRDLLNDFAWPKGRGIRLLGVSGSGFAAAESLSLFTTEKNQRKASLYAAIDNLKSRFGEDIIQ